VEVVVWKLWCGSGSLGGGEFELRFWNCSKGVDLCCGSRFVDLATWQF